MKIFVLNGPSLDRLGEREPEIYGTQTIEDLRKLCEERASRFGLEVDFRQTDVEDEMTRWVHEARDGAAGIILNPAAFTHYSVALSEAISAVGLPSIEVHISNIYAREEWRAKSIISPVARGVIAGLGFHGYGLAIEAMAEILGEH